VTKLYKILGTIMIITIVSAFAIPVGQVICAEIGTETRANGIVTMLLLVFTISICAILIICVLDLIWRKHD